MQALGASACRSAAFLCALAFTVSSRDLITTPSVACAGALFAQVPHSQLPVLLTRFCDVLPVQIFCGPSFPYSVLLEASATSSARVLLSSFSGRDQQELLRRTTECQHRQHPSVFRCSRANNCPRGSQMRRRPSDRQLAPLRCLQKTPV